jgi:hypothetical protein
MSEKVVLSVEYTFVVDTNQYMDEFAGQLTAYCTGIYSENAIEEEINYSRIFNQEMNIDEEIENNPFFNFVQQKNLGDNFYSPCSVYLNSKYGCDGHGNFALLTEDNYEQYDYPAPLSIGIFLKSLPSDELFEILKKRACKFFDEKNISVEGFRLITVSRLAEEKIL